MPTPRPQPELAIGDSGATVKFLQELLGIKVDGLFGRETEMSVKIFQRDQGLKIDGIVGPQTWLALQIQEPDQQRNSSGTSGALARVFDLDNALRNPDSLISIAIGHAEGNRTIIGGKTGNYFGHIDPGNGVENKGTFSVQSRVFTPANPGKSFTPEAADDFWLERLRGIQPKYVSVANSRGFDPNLVFLAASFFDLFTQSPGAATLKGGFLDQLIDIARQGISRSSIVKARIQSFFDPDTGRLDAPGFGNSLGRLTADQERRTDALLAVISR